jgi:TRAP-type C4-dicarboxylate transport system permease small subunit
MTTNATLHTLAPAADNPERAHHLRLAGAWALAIAFTLAIGVYGFDYYTLSAVDRPHSPKHALLRPSGIIGINLGVLGVGLFFLIYLYYFRKRFGWLRNFGTTTHWLDFHIVLGIAAPVIIAFHSAFKFRGIAGMAFGIMVAVAASGVVGRYIYAQIPRRLNAAELTWQELQDEQIALTNQMASQKMFQPGELVAAFHIPDVEMVKHKSAIGALVWMLGLDLARPFRVASLRRRALGFGGVVLSLGGILGSSNHELERVVETVRRQAALSKRMVFLSRTQQVFQLWHVVHRPFSYAFVVLAILHIATAMLLGYL